MTIIVIIIHKICDASNPLDNQINAQGAVCANDEIHDNIYKSAIGKVQT